jgi:hypothetical protein
MVNMWMEGHEGLYGVCHGHDPVNDFGRVGGTRDEVIEDKLHGQNYFEKAFPCLFPWGQGGIKCICKLAISFNDHVKWCLQYHDGQFQTHKSFPFLAFGISQC